MTDTDPAVTDWVEQDQPLADQGSWTLRAPLLALLGLATGLAAHFLLGNAPFYQVEPSAQTLAELAVITVTAGLIGFTIERRLWWAAILFALVCGAVAGAVVWWNGPPAGWSGGDGWRIACLFLAIAIAAPLFQAARDTGAPRFPYSKVHDHAWTNIVLWGACWAFVGIAFMLAYLLAALFHLIKIDYLQDLLKENWFSRALCGLAFGGALGLLREHDVVVRLLQRVVATVLAVLAPVLAIGLILFVLALPFTGLGALWDATSATTPILLSCVVGALILANAVIGDLPEHERTFPLLKFGAMGLALVVFPLAVIAAIAVGLRIGQYGFTPERLWALTFVIIATAYALAYLVSLLRGRLHWAEVVRPANLTLAFGVCAVALLLATPLVSFNAISVRDQVARLESGKITPEEFDWRALAFEFGQPGRDALKRLQTSSNAAIKAQAVETAKAENRWDVDPIDQRAERRAELLKRLRMLPAGSGVPAALADAIVEGYQCNGDQHCTVFLVSGNEALLFQDGCFAKSEPNRVSTAPANCANPDRFALKDGKWSQANFGASSTPDDAHRDALSAALAAGKIEVRTVPRRQAFIDGQPVGEPFE